MSIPVGYALGLVVLLAAGKAFVVLPGSHNPLIVALGLLLMAVPPLLTRLAWRLELTGSRPLRSRVLARLGMATMPLAYAILLGPCAYLDCVDLIADESHLLRYVLLLAPLLAAETARAIAESRCLVGRLRACHLRGRLAFVGLLTTPWLGLAIVGELLRAHREAYLLITGTTAGLTVGAIMFAALMAACLPVLFRLYFGLRTLPEDIADLQTTAAALGFPGRAVLWMDSGLRTVNALLLGWLPWPRYLVVTDGLVAALDMQALRGVVAHEVGHAQAGHPALLLALFVVAPLLLATVAQGLDIEAMSAPWLVALAIAAIAIGWKLLRTVAHRFEHEADVLSAIALGGAEPCIRALERVGQVVQQDPHRGSLLHPSERNRIEVLRGFADDPVFRAKFTLRGFRLRRCIGLLLLSAAIAAAWSWHASWPIERAVYLFNLGDFAGAVAQQRDVALRVPASQLEWWQSFQKELQAAVEIAGDGGDWETIRPKLARQGWELGLNTFRDLGGRAALPYFALATEDEEHSTVRRCMYLLCEAEQSGDLELETQIRSHLLAMDIPAELRSLLDG